MSFVLLTPNNILNDLSQFCLLSIKNKHCPLFLDIHSSTNCQGKFTNWTCCSLYWKWDLHLLYPPQLLRLYHHLLIIQLVFLHPGFFCWLFQRERNVEFPGYGNLGDRLVILVTLDQICVQLSHRIVCRLAFLSPSSKSVAVPVVITPPFLGTMSSIRRYWQRYICWVF